MQTQTADRAAFLAMIRASNAYAIALHDTEKYPSSRHARAELPRLHRAYLAACAVAKEAPSWTLPE